MLAGRLADESNCKDCPGVSRQDGQSSSICFFSILRLVNPPVSKFAAASALKIAVVEDHADLREILVAYLTQLKHDVRGFDCAEDMDEQLASDWVDLMILDINLPGEDGYSIAERLRNAHPDLYIIMLTARAAVEDRIRGYASGADIYLAKPVSPIELGATVSGVARRVHAQRAAQPALQLNFSTLTLYGAGKEFPLSAADALVLKALAEAPGRRLEYWRLLELVHSELDEGGKAALEVRISRLKRKLLDAGAGKPAIKSLWKEGYVLSVPLVVVT